MAIGRPVARFAAGQSALMRPKFVFRCLGCGVLPTLAGSSNINTREFNLDQRRAEWVRDELERRGVESGRIWLRARGFAHPIVPTGSGVAEAQNRRVAIFISNFGYTCALGQHRLRVDWLMRNCLGAMAVANETACRQGLETVRRGYFGY